MTAVADPTTSTKSVRAYVPRTVVSVPCRRTSVVPPVRPGIALARSAAVGFRLQCGGVGVWALLAVVLAATPLKASPAMIRLGYAGCQACHLSPQGRGLLTEYGKGIDDTHSARRGEYEHDETRRRRLFHDLRLLTQLRSDLGAQPVRQPAAQLRAWYRNTTFLTERVRVSGTVSADVPAPERQVTALQPLPSQPPVFVRQALLEISPRKNLYIALGRDTLPSGVEIADQATYMRSRNGQGLTDVPTQVKLFWWTPRFQVVPYAFTPSGHEARGFRTGGAGLLAETYLLGDRLATGMALRRSRNRTFDERFTGVYARLGMGRWGLLTEHDLVRREHRGVGGAASHQYTGYVQLFLYPTDWLVASIGAERLQPDRPLDRSRWSLRPELSARLSPHVTLAASLRDEYAGVQRSTTLVVQLFLKTVD